MDREKVIGHLNDCMESSMRDNTWVFVRKDIVKDAIALIDTQYKLILELQYLISIGTKMMNGDEA